MWVFGRIAEGFVLLVILLHVVMYGRRAAILRRSTACAAVERLGAIDALWAFTRECAALAAVFLLIPVGCLQSRCLHGAGTRGPVVLVHGWGANRGSLWWLRRRLLRDGWSPVCCITYRSITAGVEGAAQQLREVVEYVVAAAAQRAPITLIGHGLGGLVVRYYVRRYRAPLVRRIVTLGTPHQGTAPAGSHDAAARGRWLGRTRRRLAPGSPLLSRLNAADHVPQQFDVITISSTFDAVVLPPSNALYTGACNVQLTNVGHHTLLFSSKVYRLLAENLATPLP